MSKIVMRKFESWFLFLSLCWSTLATAQTDCSHTLVQAERAYYSGQFSQVEGLLSKCLTNGFSKEQSVQAYKLIALSSIFSKNFARADSNLLLMLKVNPQFEFDPQDPPEFRKRVEGFKVHPLFELTANLGLILPFLSVTDVYNSRIVSSEATYKGKIGSHVGISVGYYVSPKISARIGYESQRYSFIMEDRNAYSSGKLTETQSRRQWQAAAGYSFRFRGLMLQAYGGVIYSKLKKADANFVIQRTEGSDEVVYFSNLNRRTKNELRPMAELKFNVPAKNKWLLSFSVRYELGVTNLTETSDRFSDLSKAARFEWVEDNFKGSYLVASIGFSKLFYKVKLK